MMSGEEMKILDDFSFGKMLRRIKAETKMSYKTMAELSGIPYKDLYKYALSEYKRPNFVEFYKFMDFLNKSADEFLYQLIGRESDFTEMRYYASHLTSQEKQLLDQLNKLDEDQKNKFISKMLPILNLIIKK